MENNTSLFSKEAKNTLEIVPVEAPSIGTLAALAEQGMARMFRSLALPGADRVYARPFSVGRSPHPADAKRRICVLFPALRPGKRRYFGIREDGEGRLFLSKLYILRAFRGKGLSSAAFDFMEGECRRRALKAIWLTVNRHNETAIQVYLHRGFVVRKKKWPISATVL